MRYLHTMIRVTDLDASLDFYCKGLGLFEVRRKESDKGRFTLVFLAAPLDSATATVNGGDRAAPHIELTYNWPDGNGVVEDYGNARNFGHLAYEVDDIYRLCQHLSDMGVVINRPPRDGNMAFVRSPDGISIELLQKGPPKEPQEPWLSMANVGSW
ncbi:VOC family protein [Asticcacaulis sp. BYS171W]|uniref:VOC family protein n=1 Tax=Asticcacaulis aquaticus TaxID=2984212 RepID=A0ABT5I0P3_9CAUL|nr:VOC family protein [Asticcacaulis aquaticus]MDC7685251.1 VOC family protein [Asticcacaulis aquaticus]